VLLVVYYGRFGFQFKDYLVQTELK
jgi:hypothetical protein